MGIAFGALARAVPLLRELVQVIEQLLTPSFEEGVGVEEFRISPFEVSIFFPEPSNDGILLSVRSPTLLRPLPKHCLSRSSGTAIRKNAILFD